MLRILVLTAIALSGCESGPSPTDAGARADAGDRDAGDRSDAGDRDAGDHDASDRADAGSRDAGVTGPSCEGASLTPPVRACDPLATDYAIPSDSDGWATCISDDGEYHRFFPDISTIARVAAYEEIEALLFDPTSDPERQAFLDARLIYQEPEGLDSRVVRRYDPHYTAPSGTDCSIAGTPDAYPEYCVGPARLQPEILGGFQAGYEGTGPEPARVHAARIQAALLWFLAVSTYKESLTCTTNRADCDSAYAYYTGGEAARGGLGLAEDIESVDALAHARAWDGILAVRCWRDLDPLDPATDVALRDRARAQYDRAVIDGVAAVVRDRLVRLCSAEGDELAYHFAFLQVLGELLDREATVRDASAATALRDELGRPSVSDVDVARALDAIDALFDCP
jgi:hypothetical protein